MVKTDVPVEEVMNNPSLSLASAPFSSGLVIKRASFEAGEYPEHLRQYGISAGECAGRTGTVVYEGTEIPATAACVAEKHS